MTLKPLPIFPAYFFDLNGVLWGIPATCQGEHDKVKIDIVEMVDGTEKPVVVEAFCIADGMIAVQVENGTNEAGEKQYMYFGQAVGGNDIDEIACNSFEFSAPIRQTVALEGFAFYTTVYKGVEYTDIYNTGAALAKETTNPRGYGPVRVPMVDAYLLTENGLVFTTGNTGAGACGLAFWPKNRTSINPVAEAGRLWR